MSSNDRYYLVFFCFFLLPVFALSNSALASPKHSQPKANKELVLAYQTLFKKTPAQRNSQKSLRQKKQQKTPARYKATQVAKKQIQKKYRWGGSTPRTGFDCSGLTQYAYKAAQINIPRTARAQYIHTKRVPLGKLQVGDLIFFHTRRTKARVNHVGLYLGGGKFIHAPRKGKRVSVATLNKYWRRKAVGAGRV